MATMLPQRPFLSALYRGCASVLVLWSGVAVAQGGQNLQDYVEGQMSLLWPIHFSSMPLSTTDKTSLESPEWGRELARIGLDMFTRYRDTILPKELKLDKRYAEEFRTSDHSRINLAFLRWQRRVFAQRTGINVEELTGRGDPAPRIKGIDYNWKELYDNPLYKQLIHRFQQVTMLYLKRSGYTNDQLPPQKQLRIFTWVEIYEQNDAQKPWARTDGAFAMGRYFAQSKKFGLKFNFEDPRGINPPFGKTHSHAAFEGNLLMFPTWVSHFITPNMHNFTQVCYGFIAYPPDGNTLDWEDDATGAMEVNREIHIPVRGIRAFIPDKPVHPIAPRR